jgi:hypothetical protein
MFFDVTLHDFTMLQFLYSNVALHGLSICLRCCIWVFSCSWDGGAVGERVQGCGGGADDRGAVDAISISVLFRYTGWDSILFHTRGRAGLQRGLASERTRAPDVSALESQLWTGHILGSQFPSVFFVADDEWVLMQNNFLCFLVSWENQIYSTIFDGPTHISKQPIFLGILFPEKTG